MESYGRNMCLVKAFIEHVVHMIDCPHRTCVSCVTCDVVVTSNIMPKSLSSLAGNLKIRLSLEYLDPIRTPSYGAYMCLIPTQQ